MIAKYFRRTTVKKIAEDELYAAQRQLLTSQTQLEYAQSSVDTNTLRVARLKAFIAAERAEKQEPVNPGD